MTIRLLVLPVLALSLSLTASACGNSGDNTPSPNPATGPAQGGGGESGAGGQGGTSSAGGASAGGTAGSGGGSSDDPVPGCTHDSAVDHTGDATLSVTVPSGPFAYDPKCIRVKAGATITFPNSSLHPLRGMKNHGTQPNPIDVIIPMGGLPPTAATVDVSFGSPGAFGWYCMNHGSDTATPGMSGAVYVDP